MALSEAGQLVLSMRSEKDKIGVPINRALVPPHLLAGLRECLESRLLTWIDSCHHDAANGLLVDIYLLTPAGRAALSGPPQ